MSISDALRRWLYPLVDAPEVDDSVSDPEPERHHYKELINTTLYRTTLTYRNGDTETFYTHGVWQRSEDFIEFKDAVKYNWGWSMTSVSQTYSKRNVHVRLLGRDPELVPVADEWWRLTYETEDCLDSYRNRDERLDTDSITLELIYAAPHTDGDA